MYYTTLVPGPQNKLSSGARSGPEAVGGTGGARGYGSRALRGGLQRCCHTRQQVGYRGPMSGGITLITSRSQVGNILAKVLSQRIGISTKCAVLTPLSPRYVPQLSVCVLLVHRCISGSANTVNSVLVVDTPGFQNPGSCGRGSGASFADLCHNYTQERLQMLYHDTTFTAQADRYAQVTHSSLFSDSTHAQVTDSLLLR